MVYTVLCSVDCTKYCVMLWCVVSESCKRIGKHLGCTPFLGDNVSVRGVEGEEGQVAQVSLITQLGWVWRHLAGTQFISAMTSYIYISGFERIKPL